MKRFFLFAIVMAAFSVFAQESTDDMMDMGMEPDLEDSQFFPGFGGAGLIVDGQGHALLISEDISETDSFQSVAQIRAYDVNGNLAWEKRFENRVNHFIIANNINDDNLVLAFLDASAWMDDNEAGLMMPTISLVCVNTNDGAEKWSTAIAGDPLSVEPANDGSWYLKYHTYDETGYKSHLSNISAAGEARFDLITHEETWPMDDDYEEEEGEDEGEEEGEDEDDGQEGDDSEGDDSDDSEGAANGSTSNGVVFQNLLKSKQAAMGRSQVLQNLYQRVR